MRAAASAFERWRDSTPGERQLALLRLADAIERQADRLIDVECRNTGKPVSSQMPDDELPAALDQIRFFAGAARSLDGRAAGEYLAAHTSMIRREPIGVCAQITPWNYPLMTAVWKLAPAIAAGNTVVLKPSDTTPMTTVLLAEIGLEVLPPGVLNVVCGDWTTGGLLVEHREQQMVSITGSTGARHGGGADGREGPQAGPPRARRQGTSCRVRRRERGRRRRCDRRGRQIQRGSGLHRCDPGSGRTAGAQ